MKKKILNKIAVFFAVTVFFQIGVIVFILLRTGSIRSDAEKSGRVASFKCEMRDPYNPFKGRYVRLNLSESAKDFSELDSQSLEVKDSARKKPVVFCLLEKAGQGDFHITGLRLTEPEDSSFFVRARMIYCGYNVQLDFPFDEYYMQENYARKVDSLGSAFYDQDPHIEVYIDSHGNCIQKSLTVNGNVRIEDYIASILRDL